MFSDTAPSLPTNSESNDNAPPLISDKVDQSSVHLSWPENGNHSHEPSDHTHDTGDHVDHSHETSDHVDPDHSTRSIQHLIAPQPLDDTPFVCDVTNPTREQWEQLFSDAKRTNVRYVINNNPNLVYSTFCTRLQRWLKGENAAATAPLSARGRRLSVKGQYQVKRQRSQSPNDSDHGGEHDGDEDFNPNPRTERTPASQRSKRIKLQSPTSLMQPPIMPPPLMPSFTGNILSDLDESEQIKLSEIKQKIEVMRQLGGGMNRAGALFDDMEQQEIRELHEEYDAARTAVHQFRQSRVSKAT